MLSVGVDLGGHTISAALIEREGEAVRMVSRSDRETPESRKLDKVVHVIAGMIGEVSQGRQISFVGIGIPGFLDKTRSKITRFTNFSGLENVCFAEHLSSALNRIGMSPSIAMENDANCSAIGEAFCGTAKECRDFVVLTLGTGIGSGIFVNSRLLIGAHGMAGESGHMTIGKGNISCGCGSKGHLETMASADYIERSARRQGLPPDFRLLWDMRDDKRADALISGALDALAGGIASLVVVLDPEKIIVSGGMSKARGLAEEITVRTLDRLPVPLREHLKIEVSVLGADAALYGAASINMLER